MKKIFFLIVAVTLILLASHLMPERSQVVGVPPEETQAQSFSEKTLSLSWPLNKGAEREKKLTFGLYVTPDPQENPIDPPERFTGYHTALDLEIFEEEIGQEVPVFAACSGEILQTGEISGYGGVLIQSCMLENLPVTVLYGHLDFTKFKVKSGDQIEKGAKIGRLGDHRSEETSHTRKHLHFGIHKGREIEIRGYTLEKSELENFLDPLPLLLGRD